MHRATQVSPLVEAMVSGEHRANVGGLLVNDVNGLCLISKGNMSTSTPTSTTTAMTASGDNHDDANSGVYTSLTRLASTLTPYQEASMNNENPLSPLITIEIDGPASILVKEYVGHTIAIKVPNRNATD